MVAHLEFSFRLKVQVKSVQYSTSMPTSSKSTSSSCISSTTVPKRTSQSSPRGPWWSRRTICSECKSKDTKTRVGPENGRTNARTRTGAKTAYTSDRDAIHVSLPEQHRRLNICSPSCACKTDFYVGSAQTTYVIFIRIMRRAKPLESKHLGQDSQEALVR